MRKERTSNFSNEQAMGYVYYTRFIASWAREGGDMTHLRAKGGFKDWLKTLPLTEEEIDDIVFLAENGKMELENSARAFMRG